MMRNFEQCQEADGLLVGRFRRDSVRKVVGDQVEILHKIVFSL